MIKNKIEYSNSLVSHIQTNEVSPVIAGKSKSPKVLIISEDLLLLVIIGAVDTTNGR